MGPRTCLVTLKVPDDLDSGQSLSPLWPACSWWDELWVVKILALSGELLFQVSQRAASHPCSMVACNWDCSHLKTHKLDEIITIVILPWARALSWGKRLTFTEISFRDISNILRFQNHSVVEVGRDLWRSSGPTALLWLWFRFWVLSLFCRLVCSFFRLKDIIQCD